MESFEPNQIIFQKGDPGISFYIVLTGNVQIYVNTNEIDTK